VSCCRRVAVRWTFSFGHQRSLTFTPKRKARWKLNITNEQKVSAMINPLTAGGRPARIDGLVNWTVEPEGVVTVTPDTSDSKKATVVAAPSPETTLPATAQVTVEFDADLGEGVRHITAVGSVTVTEAEAETAEITFGTPEQA
jgi:hypothetical protein